MSFALILAALGMGFFGSPHCLGMCGGIVAAFGISMQHLSPAKRRMLIATYHIGRLTSYAVLGLIATIFGSQILAPFLTNNALPRLLLGGALIFAALLMLGAPFLNRLEKLGLRLWQALSPLRAKVLPIDNLAKAFGAGVLWGFLPCGLVYGALVMAVSLSATDTMNGALFMVFFGIGTLPMLLATSSMVAWLQQRIAKFNLRKFSGALMLVSGLAVAFSPSIMHALHGGSHGNHGNHSSHDHTAHHTHNEHSSHNHSEHKHSSHNHSEHGSEHESHQSHPAHNHSAAHNQTNETHSHH
ncbi:hypothetical protein B0181_09155 [Moraxella caviae]|uniref:Uncharacterized conserved protein n=1 Tax=Moraxella caviae TaxID=34060 RepID=A0A1S9ZX54_9GAMM|nr:sulfite exporter TauE/SafE family protein [Moraxella caviae]OOR88102.1 hypothetical protein B0181_09155 [Moraxella caviae]STZ09950.1 Uncharacterized conserved protein [Moraxella caviae]VEW11637.1 Uncharacterized conserved protein [Moraxella caviae]